MERAEDAPAPARTASPGTPAPPLRVREFVQEDGLVTVTIGGAPVRLEVLTVRPAGRKGPFPVALITHGKPALADDLATVHASGLRPVARDLARRGWLAVAVARRGYGLSDGDVAFSNTCRPQADLAGMFRREGDDLAAVIAEIRKRPDVDGTRVIAIGGSAGGAAVLALAGHAPAGLRAVVNVSGGLQNASCPYDDRLVAAIAALKPKVPSLWVYARNDRLFGPELAQKMHAEARAGGADARLALLDPVGEDGHLIFSSAEGRVRWYAALDAFLTDLDLPTVGAAEADAIATAAGLEASQRPSVLRYVAVPGEKALARPAGGGRLNWFLGGSDVVQARKNALEQCEKTAPACEIVAENNRPVVEKPRATAPAAAGSARP